MMRKGGFVMEVHIRNALLRMLLQAGMITTVEYYALRG